MLEASEATGMEQNENNNNFSINHAVGIVAILGQPPCFQSYILPIATKIPCKNH